MAKEKKLFTLIHYITIGGDLQIGEGQNIEKLEWVPIENLKEYDIVPPSIILFKNWGI